MNGGLLTKYAKFVNRDSFVAFLKQEFSSSLNLIYSIQNEINLS